jgi:hypothetical protein
MDHSHNFIQVITALNIHVLKFWLNFSHYKHQEHALQCTCPNKLSLDHTVVQSLILFFASPHPDWEVA